MNLLAAGVDISVIALWLGHQNTHSTDAYLHADMARSKPRTVNNICTAALIATADADKNLVDHASARAAIAEVTAPD